MHFILVFFSYLLNPLVTSLFLTQGRKMKKLLVVSTLVATSTVASAFDYKISMEGRADYVSDTTKTTAQAGTTAEEKFAGFNPYYVRLKLNGMINDNLSYGFRYKITTPSALPVRETTGSTVELMYFDHKNSMFTLRVGKQAWADSVGRETYVSGSDYFANSLVLTTFNTAVGLYRYGVSAIKKIDDVGSFTLALSNPNAAVTDNGAASATSSRKNTALAYSISYNGSFMNKMVQPLFSYTVAPQDGDTNHATATSVTTKTNNKLMAFGLRSEVAGFVIDADYKTYKKPNSNGASNTTVTNKEQTTKSMYTSVAYSINEFTPMFTYISDKFTNVDTTTAASTDSKKTSYAIGALYKPMADVNFRYHAMYTSAVTKWTGTVATNTKLDDKRLYFGFKADI